MNGYSGFLPHRVALTVSQQPTNKMAGLVRKCPLLAGGGHLCNRIQRASMS
jgi:hypothetical protein